MFSLYRGRIAATVLVVVGLLVGGVSAPAWAQPVEEQSQSAELVAETNTSAPDESPAPNDGENAADTADAPEPPPEDDTYVGSSTTSSEVYGTAGQVDSVAEDGPSDPGGDAPAPPPKDDAASAPTEDDASAVAQQYGHNVVVDSQTTETSQVEALPDGTFQLTSSAIPTRVQRDDAWVDVDTTLSPSDGFVSPGATTVPVRFSDGGTGPIAEIQLPGGDWFSESWQLGTLPSPTIDGSAALYEDVIPDVDLRLTATATGMTEVIIVNTPEAAADPRLETVKLSVSGAALAENSNGGIVATPSDDNSIVRARGQVAKVNEVDQNTALVSSDPQVWDSTAPDAGPGGPGGNEAGIPADSMIMDGDTVALDVATAVKDTDVTYPLYIDPDWGSGNIQAWSINQTYPDTHYWNVGDDADGRGNQIVGFLPEGWVSPYPGDGQQQWGRSFWQLSTAGTAGKHIIRADFNVRQSWNSSCNSTGVRLFRATNIPYAGASWNESVGVVYNGPSDVVSTNYGSNCAGQNWVGMNATQAVVDNGTGAAIILALAASDETNESWKRFNLDAQLVVHYNTIPSDPTNLSMPTPPRGCGTMSNPVYINPSLPFTLAATISDPDASPFGVEGRFRVVPYNNGSVNAIPAVAPNGYLSGGNHTSGSVQTVQLPVGALPDNGFFAWAVTAWDSYDNLAGGQGHDRSAGEPLCFFRTKSSTPNLPTITQVGSATPIVGKPMTVQFTTIAADAVMGFEYWWTSTDDYDHPELPIPGGFIYTGESHDTAANTALPGCSAVAASAHVSCLPAGAVSMTVTVAPIDIPSTLWVATFDKAGNVSRSPDRKVAAAGWSPANIQPDTTNVTFGTAASHGPGHGWRTGKKGTNADGTPETSLTSVPSSLPDLSTASNPVGLTIGDGFPKAQTSQLPTVGLPTIPVLVDVGGIALDRINGPEHAVVSAGQIPAGYHVESQLGQMAPVVTDSNGNPTSPPGTRLLFECLQPNGDNFTTTEAHCEYVPATRTTLGNIWDNIPPAIIPPADGQPADPAALQYSHIYRCSVGTDHFDTTDPHCEGFGTGLPLGYLRNLTAMQTASVPSIDTRNSFTVSAWVKPDQEAGLQSYNTIVSQTTGGPFSNFVLMEKTKTDTNGRQFRFCIRNQTGAAITDCAVQTATAANGQWVFVTGIWDATNQQLRLLVGTTTVSLTGSTTHVLPAGEPAGVGTLSVGSGYSNSCRVNMWRGSIANVTMFPGVASTAQLAQLARLKSPNG